MIGKNNAANQKLQKYKKLKFIYQMFLYIILPLEDLILHLIVP